MNEAKEQRYTPIDEEDQGSEPSTDTEQRQHLLSRLSPTRWAPKDSWARQHWRSLTVHTLLITTNLLLFVANLTGLRIPLHAGDPQHELTPFRSVVDYEPRSLDLLAIYTHNGSLNSHKPTIDFSGPPRPALERAWDNLMKHESVRVSKDDRGQFAADDTIVKLADGNGGYYFTVSAFHGLHCVQRLHHYLYPDHYYPDASEKDVHELKRHAEHCLDYFRQYIQCNADTTLIPIRWTVDFPSPVALDGGKHQCVKFDKIYDWMAKHSFDPFEPGLLVHPIFGNPFGNGSEHHVATGIVDEGKGGLLHTGDN